MIRAIAIAVTLAIVGAGAWVTLRPAPQAPSACTSDQTLTAPSGRALTLCEVLYEPQPSGDVWAVIRVLDPALPEGRETAEVTDHDWACEIWGLDALSTEPRPTRVIVQIIAAHFARGEPAPEVIQSIEAYSDQGGACMWELL